MMHQSQKQIAHSYPGCCSCLYTVAEYTRNKDLINNHESVNILAVENRRRLVQSNNSSFISSWWHICNYKIILKSVQLCPFLRAGQSIDDQKNLLKITGKIVKCDILFWSKYPKMKYNQQSQQSSYNKYKFIRLHVAAHI